MMGRNRRTAILDSKLRVYNFLNPFLNREVLKIDFNLLLQQEHTSEEKRKQQQKELAASLNEAARERLAKQKGGREVEKVRKSNASYKNLNQMPKEREIEELKIFVGKFYLFI